MKKLILISALTFLIASCSQKPKPEETLVEPEIHKELYGMWVGSFWFSEGVQDETMDYSDNSFISKLNITIKRITKDSVIAQSIAGGIILPLTGKLTETDTAVTIVLDQPKDQPNQGQFKIRLSKDTLIGTWRTFEPNKKYLGRRFKLLKQNQVYNANSCCQQIKTL